MNGVMQEPDTSGITVSPAALARVSEILREEAKGTYLRIFVQGGGCSGFTYGFSLEEPSSADSDDITVVNLDSTVIVTDPVSLQYLSGSVVDFQETLHGANFHIDNPNAETTCGCGSSFSPF